MTQIIKIKIHSKKPQKTLLKEFYKQLQIMTKNNFLNPSEIILYLIGILYVLFSILINKLYYEFK
jgi:hypothetical protein